LHKQSVAASLPCGEFEWAVHAEHVLSAVAPVSFEYFPSAQLVQRVEEAAAAYLPAGQLVQTEAPVEEYVPAQQLMQGTSVKSSPSFSALAIRADFSSLAYSSVK
jgi:hypothetical protein